jgi:hypothetical protein
MPRTQWTTITIRAHDLQAGDVMKNRSGDWVVVEQVTDLPTDRRQVDFRQDGLNSQYDPRYLKHYDLVAVQQAERGRDDRVPVVRV